MAMFRGSVYIYGTMDDAVRIVGTYAKRMALEIGDEPTYFAIDEDWFDSFRLVAQWLEYNEELTTDDLPEGRKVLEISCISRVAVVGDPNRFVERTIDAALEEFFRDGGRPDSGNPKSIPWASSSGELDEDEVERFRKRFPGAQLR
ncbi:hypothetical protein [Nocardia barduliensis]|uniref:hypothetical protein n=1 Tax=Nocardia barduliensis TaxID=2736643 RepID=UPI001574AE0E|nr:hypothetical protein [Nocardia barduliensis]